jgi:HSP20 family protein
MNKITKRDPWATLLNWPSDFADFYNVGAGRGLHIDEDANTITVEAVVAGIPAKNVDVNIEDGVLTIKAEVSEEANTKNEISTSRRRYYYSTALSGVDATKAKAEIEDGVVKIMIPKAESAKPRKIAVTTRSK